MLSPRSVRRNIFTLMKKLNPSDSKKNNSGNVEVARGCVAIYVGEERKRYQVPLTYLSLPAFQELIKRSNDDAFDVAQLRHSIGYSRSPRRPHIRLKTQSRVFSSVHGCPWSV